MDHFVFNKSSYKELPVSSPKSSYQCLLPSQATSVFSQVKLPVSSPFISHLRGGRNRLQCNELVWSTYVQILQI